MRYVIHAGVHKTGTSTLQHFLSDNAALLLAQRQVYYPVGFFQSYRRQHSSLANGLRKGDTELAKAFFTHCLEQSSKGATTTFISGEEISTLGVPVLRTLRDTLLEVDPTAQVSAILYYRNLYDLAISKMQQAAKRNRRLFEGRRDRRMISRINPTQQIKDFEGVFGEPNVRVGIFDTAIRGPGLEQDLLALADIEWSEDFKPSDSRNVSMDLISTTFINMLGVEYGLDPATWRNYAKVTSESYVLPTLRNDLVDGIQETVSDIDVSHPKLAAGRDVLTEVKKTPVEKRPDFVEFLTTFEALVAAVRQSVQEPHVSDDDEYEEED